jgi:hypothetical protein
MEQAWLIQFVNMRVIKEGKISYCISANYHALYCLMYK